MSLVTSHSPAGSLALSGQKVVKLRGMSNTCRKGKDPLSCLGELPISYDFQKEKSLYPGCVHLGQKQVKLPQQH